ncbi:MAG: hypothetical protein H6710_07950 [Myxococcales bacterium]|nr:hypothetical protein [Myxococcales bacterium]MCB9704187.1 hypothetical protein [Myxococcales bacterium]
MRSHAYLIRSERFYDLEDRLQGMLPGAPRDQILALIGQQHVIDRIELMSGEWRLLFSINSGYQPVVGGPKRFARMMVAPDMLQSLAAGLWKNELHDRWRPIAYGLSTLTYALPLASGLVGVVLLEEDEEWLFQAPINELSAIHPDVWRLLEPHYRQLLQAEDYLGLARLATDHADSVVEFTTSRWLNLRQVCQARAPEVHAAFERKLVPPGEYDGIIKGLAGVIDPQEQPSLDSWLRVHATRGHYGLYFRDIRLERLVKLSKAS